MIGVCLEQVFKMCELLCFKEICFPKKSYQTKNTTLTEGWNSNVSQHERKFQINQVSLTFLISIFFSCYILFLPFSLLNHSGPLAAVCFWSHFTTWLTSSLCPDRLCLSYTLMKSAIVVCLWCICGADSLLNKINILPPLSHISSACVDNHKNSSFSSLCPCRVAWPEWSNDSYSIQLEMHRTDWL